MLYRIWSNMLDNTDWWAGDTPETPVTTTAPALQSCGANNRGVPLKKSLNGIPRQQEQRAREAGRAFSWMK